MLLEKMYDVVLMDLNMPVLTGAEAAKSIRRSYEEETSAFLRLALTAVYITFPLRIARITKLRIKANI